MIVLHSSYKCSILFCSQFVDIFVVNNNFLIVYVWQQTIELTYLLLYSLQSLIYKKEDISYLEFPDQWYQKKKKKKHPKKEEMVEYLYTTNTGIRSVKNAYDFKHNYVEIITEEAP